MRILMVTDFYPPFLGGVEHHVRSLSTQLVARRHDVAVVTLWREGLPRFEVDQGVRIYRIQSTTQRATWLFSHPERTWAPPFPDPEALWSLARVVQREQPQIVHGHDWLIRSFLPLKASSKAKLVVSLHYYTRSCAKKNLMYQHAPCSGPGVRKCLQCGTAHYGRMKGVPIVLGNWVLAAAEQAVVDMFLPVSHATAAGNGLVGRGFPFEVVPNFVRDDVMAAAGDVEPFLVQLPGEDYLMFVGDLRRDKGLDVLLRAYARLKDAPPLVLIGKVWPETPTTFPPNVFVFKHWPNYAVMAAWQRSLVALAPSVWPEPCATVVLEAMVAGRPVIATRIGGMPDMVAAGETGLLVPPNDVAALQRAIEHLLGDAALRAHMGQAAKRKAVAFQAGTVVPQIERVYAALVEDNRDRSRVSTIS